VIILLLVLMHTSNNTPLGWLDITTSM